jgi:hypothetical protein
VSLVQAHLGEDMALLPLAVMSARVHRAPLVITIHCSLRHTLESRDLRTALLTSLGGRLERWACEEADGIIVLTERLAELKRRDGLAPDAIHVVPPGVDIGGAVCSAAAVTATALRTLAPKASNRPPDKTRLYARARIGRDLGQVQVGSLLSLGEGELDARPVHAHPL